MQARKHECGKACKHAVTSRGQWKKAACVLTSEHASGLSCMRVCELACYDVEDRRVGRLKKKLAIIGRLP